MVDLQFNDFLLLIITSYALHLQIYTHILINRYIGKATQYNIAD